MRKTSLFYTRTDTLRTKGLDLCVSNKPCASSSSSFAGSKNKSLADNDCWEANVTRFPFHRGVRSPWQITFPPLTAVNSKEHRQRLQGWVELKKRWREDIWSEPDKTGSLRSANTLGHVSGWGNNAMCFNGGRRTSFQYGRRNYPCKGLRLSCGRAKLGPARGWWTVISEQNKQSESQIKMTALACGSTQAACCMHHHHCCCCTSAARSYRGERISFYSTGNWAVCLQYKWDYGLRLKRYFCLLWGPRCFSLPESTGCRHWGQAERPV